MRFVFTSCLVPSSIAIMGHRSDSELFIYVAAAMSWIDEYSRSDRLRHVQMHRPARLKKHGYYRWISTPQSLLYLRKKMKKKWNQFYTDRHIVRWLSWLITRHPEAQGVKLRSGEGSGGGGLDLNATYSHPCQLQTTWANGGMQRSFFSQREHAKRESCFQLGEWSTSSILKASLIFSGTGWSQLLVVTATPSFFLTLQFTVLVLCVLCVRVYYNFNKVKNYAHMLLIWKISHWGNEVFLIFFIFLQYISVIFGFLNLTEHIQLRSKHLYRDLRSNFQDMPYFKSDYHYRNAKIRQQFLSWLLVISDFVSPHKNIPPPDLIWMNLSSLHSNYTHY